jgi:DNA-binding FadR family transcriptional regulator
MRAQRLKEQYARRLLDEIAAGDPQPGTLLTQEQVATRFGISLGSARELIQILELCGALDVRHGRGSLVRPPQRWNPLIPMVIRARIESPRGREIADAYFEAARWFVVLAAMSAASERSRAQLAPVDAELRRLEAATETVSGAAADARLLRAWAASLEDHRRAYLGAHLGDALANALDVAAERIPALGGEQRASVAIQRVLHTAATEGDTLVLLGFAASLIAPGP